ncbi:hypothetical protein ACLOJK_010798 [Asimina triloba]
MLLAVLFSNSEGNILIERFHGVPAEERLHWRSFLVKLGADNLKGAKNEELFVASHKYLTPLADLTLLPHFKHHLHTSPHHLWSATSLNNCCSQLDRTGSFMLLLKISKSVYIVYTMLGDVCIYVVGKDEYDELALAEVIFVITSSLKDVCGKPPTERLFLDKYGKICLCLDEIVCKQWAASIVEISKTMATGWPQAKGKRSQRKTWILSGDWDGGW